MGNALRQTVAEPKLPNAGDAATFLERPASASSPVHDLHDMLARRLSDHPVAPKPLTSQSRMAIMFWLAVAAWAVVLLGAYAAVALF